MMYLSMLGSFILWHILWCALPCFSAGSSYDPFGVPANPHPLDIDMRRMFCKGELPQGQYGKTRIAFDLVTRMAKSACQPDAWSAANFTTLADLCTAHVFRSFLNHVHTKLTPGVGQSKREHGRNGEENVPQALQPGKLTLIRGTSAPEITNLYSTRSLPMQSSCMRRIWKAGVDGIVFVRWVETALSRDMRTNLITHFKSRTRINILPWPKKKPCNGKE